MDSIEGAGLQKHVAYLVCRDLAQLNSRKHAMVEETKEIMRVRRRSGGAIHVCTLCSIPYMPSLATSAIVCSMCPAILACGRDFCMDAPEYYQCAVCNELLCHKCVTGCYLCPQKMCDGCETYCADCDKPICLAHATPCDECKRVFCRSDECIRERKCNHC